MSRDEFFKSGFLEIDRVLNTVRQHIDQNFAIKRALDFGCGVGRLVIPLAHLSQEVTGVDVSASMLDEARNNCIQRSLTNVDFVKSDDGLSLLKGKYNLIHSHIVFQHIPVSRGVQIFEKLLSHLDDGGVCVVHFTYANEHMLNGIVAAIKKYVPYASNFINLLRGRNFFAPQMQMNSYDMNRIFRTMQTLKIPSCYTEFLQDESTLGLVLYFKSPNVAT